MCVVKGEIDICLVILFKVLRHGDVRLDYEKKEREKKIGFKEKYQRGILSSLQDAWKLVFICTIPPQTSTPLHH